MKFQFGTIALVLALCRASQAQCIGNAAKYNEPIEAEPEPVTAEPADAPESATPTDAPESAAPEPATEAPVAPEPAKEAVPVKVSPNTGGSTTYVADLGICGSFELTTSANDGLMDWDVSLVNIQLLEDALVELGDLEPGTTLTELDYHLHQQWTTKGSDIGVGSVVCSPDVSGGHYDPYLGCGPASGQSDAACEGAGRPRTAERYQCTTAYDALEYDRCEVGDLSGKGGAIPIDAHGSGALSFKSDPLPALDWHFMDDTNVHPPGEWNSIVIHNGAPRVLCARVFKK